LNVDNQWAAALNIAGDFEKHTGNLRAKYSLKVIGYTEGVVDGNPGIYVRKM